MNKKINIKLLSIFAVYIVSLLSMNAQELILAKNSQNSSGLHLEKVNKIKAFMGKYCYDCHDDDVNKGDINLYEFPQAINSSPAAEYWIKVLDQVKADLMPPINKKRPDLPERQLIVSDIEEVLYKSNFSDHYKAKLLRPEYGNYVDHDLLFNGSIKAAPYTPSRIWRYSPEIYRTQKGLVHKFTRAPFEYINSNTQFQDYSSTSMADQGTVETIMTTIEKMVKDELIKVNGGFAKTRVGEYEKKIEVKADPKHPYKPFVSNRKPTPDEIQKVINNEFLRVIRRKPNKEELNRYQSFVTANISDGDNLETLKAILLAINLNPEAIYRKEFGSGSEDQYGRRMLSTEETMQAISFALSDVSSYENKMLSKISKKEQLNTVSDIQKIVKQMLYPSGKNADYLKSNPRIMRFFQQYFNYENSDEVFKDESRKKSELDLRFPSKKLSQQISKDLDVFVHEIVKEDKDVFRRLLTSNGYYISHTGDNKSNKTSYDKYMKKQLGKDKGSKKFNTIIANAKKLNLTPPPTTGFSYVKLYNFPYGAVDQDIRWSYPIEQPVIMENRKGILTHPAWLWTYSTNFDNDPIHRGIWIYRKLLAGILADVPPDVDAKVPENPHKTLRERMDVIREKSCWKCHRKINPLGEAFENFDDFGRYRTVEYFDKKNGEIVKNRDDAFRKMAESNQLIQKSVNSSADLDEMGVHYLKGKVNNAFELIDKIASSERARQSFVRHAFRYFLGRNEMLTDSKTLIEADKAYVESGGSFRALVLSLLTSDSFIYRK